MTVYEDSNIALKCAICWLDTKLSLTLQISYEYLIVALGLQLHYEKVGCGWLVKLYLFNFHTFIYRYEI